MTLLGSRAGVGGDRKGCRPALASSVAHWATSRNVPVRPIGREAVPRVWLRGKTLDKYQHPPSALAATLSLHLCVCPSTHPSITPYLLTPPAPQPSLSLTLLFIVYYLSLLPVSHPPTFPSHTYLSVGLNDLSFVYSSPPPPIHFPSILKYIKAITRIHS